MNLYRIELFDEKSTVCDVLWRFLAIDNDAIDHAESIAHPHEMTVWQSDRIVAHFPAVGQRFD